MLYRIIQTVEGRMVQSETTDIFAWAEVHDLKVIKLNDNHHQRAELQGHPVFGSLCGPMWDGDAIRYEDQRSNDTLSA